MPNSIYLIMLTKLSIYLGGVIYTDISKDGKLSGPNFDLTGRLALYTSCL